MKIRAVCWLNIAEIVDGEIEADVSRWMTLLFKAFTISSRLFFQFMRYSMDM